MALLREIADAEKRERGENDGRHQDHFPDLRIVIQNPNPEKQGRDDRADRQNDEAWRERKQQRFHGTPQADSAIILLIRPQPNPTIAPMLYTISRAPVMDMTAIKLANRRGANQSVGWRGIGPRSWGLLACRV